MKCFHCNNLIKGTVFYSLEIKENIQKVISLCPICNKIVKNKIMKMKWQEIRTVGYRKAS